LRQAEKASPAVATTAGAQRLAAVTGALSGEARVFTGAPTPPLTPGELAAVTDDNLLVSADADRARRLAGQLRQAPALNAFGLSLEGDAEKAAGDAEAARRSFEAAAAIRATPSLSKRLGRTKAISPGRLTPAATGRSVVTPARGNQ
jgi:hypothetical protein